MEEFLNEFSLIIKIPIAWGEMDSFNHVNNVYYIRYFESARTKHFLDTGYLDFMKQVGKGPILASISCKYKLPLNYPDMVLVGTRVYKMDEDRFWMNYKLFSESLQKITTEGDSCIVSYDYKENKKCTIPEIIKEKIIQLEKKSIEFI